MKLNKIGAMTAICLMACLILAGGVFADDGKFRVVKDSRGVEVKVPQNIKRVVTISDGLIEAAMVVLGEQDKIVGIGSGCMQEVDTYKIPSVLGKDINLEDGMNTVMCLYPPITKLPKIADWNAAPNYEAISGLKPDVMIIRVGSCWHFDDNDQVPKSIAMLESLGIPVVVLKSPNTYGKPDMSVISDEIRIVGQVFGKQPQADKLAKYLESQVALVKERTKDVSESEKPRVLLLGLSPRDREKGGAGTVSTLDTTESHFVEDVAHAHNAFQERGGEKMVNTEQVLAMDPDVILLPTYWGYHPPRELYEAPYYQNLQELKAVKNRRVAALPWTPCNCDKRVEYPLDVMVIAKAAYPDKFQDIKFSDWIIEFYKNVYGVDDQMAKKLRSAQWLDWTLEE